MKKVCIIGAGIVGTSVAYHLSRYAGVGVSIVDGGHPGAGTTSAGTGLVGALVGSREYFELRREGMREHRALAHSWGGTWLQAGGSLQTEDFDSDFETRVEQAGAWGYPVEVWSAARVQRELEPRVRFPDGDLRVAYYPEEFAVDGALLARTLFERAVDNGAIGHFGSTVTGLELLAGDRHRISFTDGTDLVVDAVVNAAGARADLIAAQYGIPMPLEPRLGIGMRIAAPGNPLRRVLYTASFVAKPEGDGIVRLRSLQGWGTSDGVGESGGDMTGGLDRTRFAQAVAGQAAAYIPGLEPLRPLVTHVGVRPMPADGYPRVGAVAAVPGYFDAVTHSGGCLGPLLGRLLAAEVATGEPSDLLRNYRPHRFFPAPVG